MLAIRVTDSFLFSQGLLFLFGINTTSKPYFLVLEFYAIDGKWTTLQKAAESKMFSTLATWANIVKECCYALFYIHSMNYVNCDIKSDNIVLRNGFGDAVETYSAVIIDFGEMKELSKTKILQIVTERARKIWKISLPHCS